MTDRKRCLFMMGNGISLDFLQVTGLKSPIDLSNPLKALPPAHESFPLPAKRFMEDTSIGFLEFCAGLRADADKEIARQHGATGDSGPALGRGLNTWSEESQLREFLWREFLKFDQFFRAEVSRLRAKVVWGWANIIRASASTMRCAYVSYNYDFIPTSLVSQALYPRKLHALTSFAGMDLFDPANACIIHIHGNIGFGVGIRLVEPSAAMRVAFQELEVSGLDWQYPPASAIPVPVDLVPPGFCNRHTYNARYADLFDAASAAVKLAEVIVLAGFSARGVDREELEALCGGSLDGKQVIHCVPNEDSTLRALVGTLGGRYQFVSSSDPEKRELARTLRLVDVPFLLAGDPPRRPRPPKWRQFRRI